MYQTDVNQAFFIYNSPLSSIRQCIWNNLWY